MKYSETGIKGLWVIEPQRFGDKRGYFMETFRLDEFTLATGTDVSFVQDNESLSSRGVLRGLHFQRGSFSQAKLVRVSMGRVLDVAVDLRLTYFRALFRHGTQCGKRPAAFHPAPFRPWVHGA